MGYVVLCGISYQSLGWSLIYYAEGGLQDLVSLVKYKYDQQFPTLGIGRVYWSISDFAFYRC